MFLTVEYKKHGSRNFGAVEVEIPNSPIEKATSLIEQFVATAQTVIGKHC